MKTEHQPSYLRKHALVLSSIVALIATVLVWGFGLLGTPEPTRSAGLGGNSEPFAAVPREDLEATYHQAWQIIGRNYIDQPKLRNWQSWEHKFDGQIRTDRQLAAAIEEMLASLDDRYSVYISAKELHDFEHANSGKMVGIGVGLNDSNGIVNVMPGSPALKAGLKSGDVIAAVDGNTVGALSTTQLVALIRGDNQEGTTVVLTVVRDGKTEQVPVVRDVIKREPAVRSQRLPGFKKEGNSIRVDNLRADNALKELVEAVEGMNKDGVEGFVLDLRGLQGGSSETAARVAALFLEQGFIAQSVEWTEDQLQTTTHQIADGKLVVWTVNSQKGTNSTTVDAPVNLYKGKLVVLVDENTSGAAEIVTAALKDHKRATVVGIKTAGKGSAQRSFYLNGRHVIRVTTARYQTPVSLQPINGVGVQPDVVIDAKDRATMFAKAMQELSK